MGKLPQNNKPMLSLSSFSLRRFHAKTEDMTHNRYLHNCNTTLRIDISEGCVVIFPCLYLFQGNAREWSKIVAVGHHSHYRSISLLIPIKVGVGGFRLEIVVFTGEHIKRLP